MVVLRFSAKAVERTLRDLAEGEVASMVIITLEVSEEGAVLAEEVDLGAEVVLRPQEVLEEAVVVVTGEWQDKADSEQVTADNDKDMRILTMMDSRVMLTDMAEAGWEPEALFLSPVEI